jgi:hypothetical protein
MEADFRQLLLLAIAVVVPVVLLWTKRERLLLGWVCITFFVQIFDTAVVTNLPAGRVVGLLYAPFALSQVREWLQVRPVRFWAINFCYLLLLGLLFGWLWPWPDITMTRPFSLTSQGRSIVYLVRLLSDISLAVFIANQLKRPGTVYYLARALVLGATLTALVGVSYLFIKVDWYFLITGIGEQAARINRARGLSLEPRALGLCCAYGTMILLLGRSKLFKGWLILLLINLVALLITYSTSSLALLVAGIFSASFFFSNRERGVVAAVTLLLAMLVVGATMYAPEQVQQATDTIQLRLDPDYKLAGIPPGNIGQEIAYRLDVFDASALLFLLEEPLYALTGTGPGLVSLPASYHVPPGLYSFIWTTETGINNLPSHGLLVEVSNSGLLGLILWLAQVISCWAALRYATARLRDPVEKLEWTFAHSLFLMGIVFYLVQVSSSPVWSVILAIGWTVSRAVQEITVKAEQSATNVILPQRGTQTA